VLTRVDVAVTPGGLATARLAGVTVLVIDVFRASTTMVTALAHGCAGIVPVADADEARSRASAAGGRVLVAGERRGVTIPGFDLGNSPLEFTPAVVAGATVVFTTSNGTGALLAARGAAAVGVAGFVNLSAAVAWALAEGRDVLALCAGERGRPSLEDHVCAGLLVDRLLAQAPATVPTPAAAEARRLARAYDGDLARLATDSAWGRHLTAEGRAADLVACLALDSRPLVPRYRPDVDKVLLDSR
jgi:2-phosphosulfolactate phosphatase